MIQHLRENLVAQDGSSVGFDSQRAGLLTGASHRVPSDQLARLSQPGQLRGRGGRGDGDGGGWGVVDDVVEIGIGG